MRSDCKHCTPPWLFLGQQMWVPTEKCLPLSVQNEKTWDPTVKMHTFWLFWEWNSRDPNVKKNYIWLFWMQCLRSYCRKCKLLALAAARRRKFGCKILDPHSHFWLTWMQNLEMYKRSSTFLELERIMFQESVGEIGYLEVGWVIAWGRIGEVGHLAQKQVANQPKVSTQIGSFHRESVQKHVKTQQLGLRSDCKKAEVGHLGAQEYDFCCDLFVKTILLKIGRTTT